MTPAFGRVGRGVVRRLSASVAVLTTAAAPAFAQQTPPEPPADELGRVVRERITVDRACLACHGAKEERPAFVKENYPGDRAYGFEVGDLRGAYSVFVPLDVPGEGGRH